MGRPREIRGWEEAGSVLIPLPSSCKVIGLAVPWESLREAVGSRGAVVSGPRGWLHALCLLALHIFVNEPPPHCTAYQPSIQRGFVCPWASFTFKVSYFLKRFQWAQKDVGENLLSSFILNTQFSPQAANEVCFWFFIVVKHT